jgi:hypothetical protein
VTNEEIAQELAERLRQDNMLRHRLHIEGAVDTISDSSDGPKETVAYTTAEGQDVFIRVEAA